MRLSRSRQHTRCIYNRRRFSPKTVFRPGDTIHYHVDVDNTTDAPFPIEIIIDVRPDDYSPDPRLYNYETTIHLDSMPVGFSRFYHPATIPADAGAYEYSVRITVAASGTSTADWAEADFTIQADAPPPVGPTAGRACMFHAPNGGFLLGLVGHVGWAFRDGTGDTWIYGATENTGGPGGEASAYIDPGDPEATQSWQASGTWAQVLAAFHSGTNADVGPGYYQQYRCQNTAQVIRGLLREPWIST